jgi:hypothetical protein
MDNYKIIKKINEGFFGVVYLIKIDNKKYVLKRQKILKKDMKFDLKHNIWREIEFSQFINKLPKRDKNYFMLMNNYQIIECKMKKFHDNINDPKLKKLNNSKYCIDIIYEYKNNIYNDIVIKNKISLKEKYSSLIQILNALIILKKKGYTHNDLHFGNIAYDKRNSIIKIRNKIIKSKYQYSLLDYGLVHHKKYPKNDFDKYKDEEQLQLFINQLSRINILGDIYKNNKWKFNKKLFNPNYRYNWLLPLYKNNNLWNKIKDTLLELYPHFKNFYNIYERDLKDLKSELTKTLDKRKDLIFLINVFFHINILFLSYSPKEYYHTYGFTKTKNNNFIPGKDLEFLLLNSFNYKKLITYFLKKLI